VVVGGRAGQLDGLHPARRDEGEADVIVRCVKSRGFALVIVVSLLALLVLVLVALASLTRVETSVAGNTRKFSQARQNALLALNVALGRLQETAGSDQRFTATAEFVTDAKVQQTKWTGVGDSTNPSQPLAWLVSGTAPDPTVSVVGGHTLVGGNSAGTDTADHVVAALQEIQVAAHPSLPGQTNVTVGRYAWWVGDEGVKARVNLVNPLPTTPDGGWTAAQTADWRERRLAAAQRFGVERSMTGSFAGSQEPAKVLSLNQTAFISGVTTTEVRNRFHDLTTHSFGVLANVRNGGLKKDLTRGLADATPPTGLEDNTTIYSGGPRWGVLRSFHQHQAASETVGTSVPSATNSAIHPILTAVTLWIGGMRQTGGVVRVVARPTIVLANPYDAAIAPMSYRLSFYQELLVSCFKGASAGALTAIGGIPSSQLNMVMLGGSDTTVRVFFFTPEIGFQPGEVRVLTLGTEAMALPQRGAVLTAGGSNPGYAMSVPITGTLGASDDLWLKLTGAGGLTLTLEWTASSASWGSTFLGPHQDTLDLDVSIINDATPIKANVLTDGAVTTDVTGLTLFLRGSSGIAGSGGRAPILLHGSPRQFLFSALSGDPWGINPFWAAADPSSGAGYQVTSALWGPSYEPGIGLNRVVLYHVPRRNLLSLGQLRHASFVGETLISFRYQNYAIGNSYASPYFGPDQVDPSYGLNDALWDRFFFSGFSSDSVPTVDADFPNPRLIPYYSGGARPTTATYDTAAARLLVKGAFNVNSASLDAWKALLASLNQADGATDNPAFRTPHPVSGTSGADAPWSGYRTLTSTQIDNLAAAIRQRVLERGPFYSMSRFVNRRLETTKSALTASGLIQDAIDSISGLNPGSLLTSINAPSPAGTGLPYLEVVNGQPLARGAPGWLMQGDLLTPLGPVLSARSDTFLIRTYGETVNPLLASTDPNYVQGRAWCEAVVQRVPEYVDTTQNPWETAAGTNATLGRRFVITSFRWLTPDDI
jgi:hypothetical protein